MKARYLPRALHVSSYKMLSILAAAVLVRDLEFTSIYSAEELGACDTAALVELRPQDQKVVTRTVRKEGAVAKASFVSCPCEVIDAVGAKKGERINLLYFRSYKTEGATVDPSEVNNMLLVLTKRRGKQTFLNLNDNPAFNFSNTNNPESRRVEIDTEPGECIPLADHTILLDNIEHATNPLKSFVLTELRNYIPAYTLHRDTATKWLANLRITDRTIDGIPTRRWMRESFLQEVSKQIPSPYTSRGDLGLAFRVVWHVPGSVEEALQAISAQEWNDDRYHGGITWDILRTADGSWDKASPIRVAKAYVASTHHMPWFVLSALTEPPDKAALRLLAGTLEPLKGRQERGDELLLGALARVYKKPELLPRFSPPGMHVIFFLNHDQLVAYWRAEAGLGPLPPP